METVETVHLNVEPEGWDLLDRMDEDEFARCTIEIQDQAGTHMIQGKILRLKEKPGIVVEIVAESYKQ